MSSRFSKFEVFVKNDLDILVWKKLIGLSGDKDSVQRLFAYCGMHEIIGRTFGIRLVGSSVW